MYTKKKLPKGSFREGNVVATKSRGVSYGNE